MNIIKVDTRALEALIAKTENGLDGWLAGVANEIGNDAKLIMNTGPRGRMYKRGAGKVHYASSPGYPPNVDTGALRASIRAMKKGNLRYWIVDGVEHGITLENGGTRIAPRPFMRPAMAGWQNGKLATSLTEWLKR